MIKNIIFDFGDVFINLDKEGAYQNALDLFQITSFTSEMISLNEQYEIGAISSSLFIKSYQKLYPELTELQIIEAWNFILKDFPLHRLSFLQELTKNHRCFLLSNTNAMHIEWIKNDWGINLYQTFVSCFEQFYLSYEIGLRKPNTDIFNFVLEQNNLIAQETLFVDDTPENTEVAKKIGLHTWNNNPSFQDVTELFTIKEELF